MTLRRILLSSGIALALLLVAAGGFFLYAFRLPLGFALDPDTPTAPPATLPLTPPPALTDEELAYQRWFSSITWQLPPEEEAIWSIGGTQFDVDAIRYQAAFLGYAAAALGSRTPAYPGPTRKILDHAIQRLIDRSAWRYIERYWRDQPGFPDPCANENVMYTGHLLQLLVLYEALSGDDRYRREGFELVWSETERVHYDTMKLAHLTVTQMRASDCGGIACEPGLVFFPCNNHPHIALTLLEQMGLGAWKEERQRWEKWALESYRAAIGQAAFRAFYHQGSSLFLPIGLPGGDAWSLLWYMPWTENPGIPPQLWRMTLLRFDPQAFITEKTATEANHVEHLLGRPLPPRVATASFLAPAARICGDIPTAELLEQWLDEHFLAHHNKGSYLNVAQNWRIGTTANRALSLALAQGSDLRQMVQSPLERAYFTGPLLEEVTPAQVDVYQAYRSENRLILEINAHGQSSALTLRNVPAIEKIEGIQENDWSYHEGILTLPPLARQILIIHPAFLTP